MRKSALCRPRALQILQLKRKCILERDDRKKSCSMGCTYWCKIMSRAAFDIVCVFCSKLQCKLLTSSKSNKLLTKYMQGMKQDYVDGHEDTPHKILLWCPGHSLPCHACLQFAADLLKLEQVVTPQNQWRNGEAGSADTPREKEQEDWMLSPGDNFIIGFNSGYKAI